MPSSYDDSSSDSSVNVSQSSATQVSRRRKRRSDGAAASSSSGNSSSHDRGSRRSSSSQKRKIRSVADTSDGSREKKRDRGRRRESVSSSSSSSSSDSDDSSEDEYEILIHKIEADNMQTVISMEEAEQVPLDTVKPFMHSGRHKDELALRWSRLWYAFCSSDRYKEISKLPARMLIFNQDTVDLYGVWVGVVRSGGFRVVYDMMVDEVTPPGITISVTRVWQRIMNHTTNIRGDILKRFPKYWGEMRGRWQKQIESGVPSSLLDPHGVSTISDYYWLDPAVDYTKSDPPPEATFPQKMNKVTYPSNVRSAQVYLSIAYAFERYLAKHGLERSLLPSEYKRGELIERAKAILAAASSSAKTAKPRAADQDDETDERPSKRARSSEETNGSSSRSSSRDTQQDSQRQLVVRNSTLAQSPVLVLVDKPTDRSGGQASQAQSSARGAGRSSRLRLIRNLHDVNTPSRDSESMHVNDIERPDVSNIAALDALPLRSWTTKQVQAYFYNKCGAQDRAAGIGEREQSWYLLEEQQIDGDILADMIEAFDPTTLASALNHRFNMLRFLQILMDLKRRMQ